ncbi:restriction endonuclease [Pseudomonas syringae]|uniref:restriction endonuclease n=1 Tax=Pseudomonas syringae TaxID=317 RepID=UPI000BB5CB3F|nr:restriction endonuclease [Pseudomonas syringae]PBP73985.1 restriction endonuclease [Pseudomonas syringae]
MKIEVACAREDTTKQKGDLLENLAKGLLTAQSYTVIQEIRIVGAELDLLCKHKVSGKEIYVECKAQKEPVSAPVIRQLWGTVDSEDYAEGWLISTSGFTKDGKGFIESWKQKPIEKSSRLSFYNPEQIIDSLISASVIKSPPLREAAIATNGEEYLGEWTLLISKFGIYWCVYTLEGGAPNQVLAYRASTGQHITDSKEINNIGTLESTLANYKFLMQPVAQLALDTSEISTLPLVVEVQTGESWDDYRPARPQDFIGRDSLQKEILNFLDTAKNNNGSRVFALTGNSGLGKSSLVAKLRDRSRNIRYKNKYFVYAVDVRGAKNSNYILASLIECLKQAQANGFGDNIDITLTNPDTPLNSTAIQNYLNSLEKKNQVVCLIFDQFEELYSKPELFGIFKTSKDLMLDVAACKKNIVLGFAWKTDSTTQQDHPAYHMWHELSDHRREYRLEVFDSGEITKSVTMFEKQVGQKLGAETRHQIIHSSQGFPWLIKKLCINLFEGRTKGEGSESLFVDLDVGRLFESDLISLTPQEITCLRLVAQKAPADWSEIIETAGTAVLNSLIHKRLVVKSGDRLNIYWDIFKDYLLSGKVPVVPFNYIPTNELPSGLKLCEQLTREEFISAPQLAGLMNLNEKTIWNIGADLVMFGLAERAGTSFKLHQNINIYGQDAALRLLREKMSKHSFKISLYKKYSSKSVEHNGLKEVLKSCLPKASYSDKTWTTYTSRLTNLLVYTGYLTRSGHSVIVQDLGTPSLNPNGTLKRRRSRGAVFSISVSPYIVLETMQKLGNSISDLNTLNRNPLSVLKRFDLIISSDTTTTLNREVISKYGGDLEAIWSLAKNEPSLARCVEILNINPNISPKSLANEISKKYNLNWADGSLIRNGNILKQWSSWIKEGIDSSKIPSPPGRPAFSVMQN